ncbi:unnamed protein product [Rotaria sp. Silwood1]|nr:unnamed protein product [Rotaria sp. Silwood1]
MTAKLLRQIKSLWKIGDVAASTESVSNIEPRRLMVPNYLLIWVDEAIDETNDNCQHMLAQLRSVVNNVRLCTNTTQCIEVLNDADSKKVFVVSSDDLGQHLVPEIHQITQVDSIYIFSNNQVLHEKWTKDWSKIQGIFTSIQSICDLLKTSIREYDHHAIPMSFVPKLMIDTVIAPAVSDKQNLDQLEPSFMYSLLFKKVLLEIDEDDAKPLQDLVVYCRSQNIPEPQLELFQQEYYLKTPVWCFMGDVYRLLEDYETALSYHQKALNIQEIVPCSPLECATVYTNMGDTYREMKDYATALTFFQKALEIHETRLPKDHPDLALISHSLAKLYLATGERSKATEHIQKAMKIAEIRLPLDHPHLSDYKETFEKIQMTL